MQALQKLQRGPEADPDQKPYHGFTNLRVGYYKIVGFRAVKNPHHKKSDKKSNPNTVIVELNKEIVFLPQYFASKLTAEDIDELNSNTGEDMFLYFGGKREGRR